MAKTIDTTLEKQRKQKKILIVLGVVLVALTALQGPKLMKQLSGSSAPAAAPAGEGSTTAESSGTSVPPTTIVVGSTPTAAGSVTSTTPVPVGVPRAVLVGVTVGAGGTPKPGEGQLRAFTLFTSKDPFVQQLPKEPAATSSAPTEPAKGGSGSAAGGGTAGGGDGGSTPVDVAPLAYATVAVNGQPEPLTLKQVFPEADPLFVLVSLKGQTAKIAVAGGSFTDGQTVTLTMDKPLTLVNTATGARYTVKLLYVGAEAEQVEVFTKKPAEPKKK